MLAYCVSLLFFAAVTFAAPIADSTISGGTVTINGEPLSLPPGYCYIDGEVKPEAECPSVPTTGLIRVVNGQLLSGDVCKSQPNAIDQGPPAPAERLAKRAAIDFWWFDCKGNWGFGLPNTNYDQINQSCLSTNGQVLLNYFCTAAERPSLKCLNPQPIPGKPFPYPVNT